MFDAPTPADEARQRTVDALYVAVGCTILTFQRLQVRRREFERSFGPATLPNVAAHLDVLLDKFVSRPLGENPK